MRWVSSAVLIAVIFLAACTAPGGATAVIPATAIPALPGFITISHPLEDLVTDQPQVALQGRVTEEVILSVNEDIHLLPPGDFDLPLSLEPGVNIFEIVASTYAGETFELVLLVTYEP